MCVCSITQHLYLMFALLIVRDKRGEREEILGLTLQGKAVGRSSYRAEGKLSNSKI